MLVGAAVGAVVIGGGIVIYNNREAVGDAIEKSMEMRGEAEFIKCTKSNEILARSLWCFFQRVWK